MNNYREIREIFSQRHKEANAEAHLTHTGGSLYLQYSDKAKSESCNVGKPLLHAPWRGRAVANSPMLQLDESTVNASNKK